MVIKSTIPVNFAGNKHKALKKHTKSVPVFFSNDRFATCLYSLADWTNTGNPGSPVRIWGGACWREYHFTYPAYSMCARWTIRIVSAVFDFIWWNTTNCVFPTGSWFVRKCRQQAFSSTASSMSFWVWNNRVFTTLFFALNHPTTFSLFVLLAHQIGN